ncbi:MAG: hypothetical protein ACLGRW_09365 [Acidobacteriota bacterium]
MLKSTPKRDVSAGEVARILAALRAGIDSQKLAREIAVRRPESASAVDRLVDIALACLWLTEGAPIGDVLTMLESRRRFGLSSAACRAYAVEILWTAERHVRAFEDHPNTAPKEPDYAAA